MSHLLRTRGDDDLFVDNSAPETIYRAPVTASSPRRVSGGLRALSIVIGFVVLVLLWAGLAGMSDPTLLPGPLAVWDRFTQAFSDGVFLPALGTTAEEAALGWLIAAAAALPLGYALGRLRPLEDALAPYLAGAQAMPIVAFAPLLIAWLGFGLLPKVVVCALIAYFPMLATTASGVRGVPRDLRDAARVFGASALPLALRIDLPLAARTILAGVKVAAALSVTGAVVAEFVAADQGLGFLVDYGRQTYDTPLMFVGLISLMAMGAAAYAVVNIVERILLQWDE